MRIGHSTDIHRLEPGNKLIIGGVTIPYILGSVGHSDGDCLLHTVCESLTRLWVKLKRWGTKL
jgi:2-C-methyl-D-erythritol 2,4-cyclodiphosphate synthase